MAPRPSEADVIFNRANVALAKSQRLVASWLPPRTEAELQSSKSEEQIEKEEQELFTPVPELLGLGAKVPDDLKDGGALNKQKLTSDDLLRKQLLGKDYLESKRKEERGQRGSGVVVPLGSKPLPAAAKRKAEDVNSEDEGGRSSLGKKKHREYVKLQDDRGPETQGGGGEVDHRDYRQGRPEVAERSVKATNYLDEVLSRKSEKKRKSKKKRNVAQDGLAMSKSRVEC
ncbi:MAG: hypothetical protein LQ348_006072 [Seirophora lacunosa]|nr:MAG: hypothetical protein LQ348_006072 [Seirophora lacunosa]